MIIDKTRYVQRVVTYGHIPRTHRPNFLILDEPTNHLDVETVDALAKALTKFKVRVCVLMPHILSNRPIP